MKFCFIAMGLLASLTLQGIHLCYAAKKRAPEIYSATETESGNEPAAPLNMPGDGQMDSDSGSAVIQVKQKPDASSSEKTEQPQIAGGADAQPAPAVKKAKPKVRTKSQNSQNFKTTHKVMAQFDVNRSLRQIEADLKEIKAERKLENDCQGKASIKLVGQPKTTPYTYDPVPHEQADVIAKRLQIVEILLRKYGRAYDYRVYTYRDLKKILTELDRGAAATSAPVDDILTPPEVPSADQNAF